MNVEEIMAAAAQRAKAECSQSRTIAAEDVLPDDLIYNGSNNHWIRVVDVKPNPFNAAYTIINTTNWATYKHCREGIAVKRGEWKSD